MTDNETAFSYGEHGAFLIALGTAMMTQDISGEEAMSGAFDDLLVESMAANGADQMRALQYLKWKRSEAQGQELKPFVVLSQKPGSFVLDEEGAFTSMTMDGDHAEEQFSDAYPDSEVVWVTQTNDVCEAIGDYTSAGSMESEEKEEELPRYIVESELPEEFSENQDFGETYYDLDQYLKTDPHPEYRLVSVQFTSRSNFFLVWEFDETLAFLADNEEDEEGSLV